MTSAPQDSSPHTRITLPSWPYGGWPSTRLSQSRPTRAKYERKILARGEGKDDLRTVLHTVWDLGVVVLPLKGQETFHGAVLALRGP